MKKVISLLIVVGSLSGCAPVALVCAGAGAGGSVVGDNRALHTQISDQNKRQTAINNMNRIPGMLENSHISASVFNGSLLLVGQAATPELREQAEIAARRAGPFKRIYNRVDIGQPATITQISHDTWLTTKVKTAMIAEKKLHSTQIKVITDDKIVYLLGIVNADQASLAIEVAKEVPGVTKVVTLFEYTT